MYGYVLILPWIGEKFEVLLGYFLLIPFVFVRDYKLLDATDFCLVFSERTWALENVCVKPCGNAQVVVQSVGFLDNVQRRNRFFFVPPFLLILCSFPAPYQKMDGQTEFRTHLKVHLQCKGLATMAAKEVYKPILEELQEQGPRLYARWDKNLFENYCASKVRFMSYFVRAHKYEQEVLRAYATLLAEAVGHGYINRADIEIGRASPHRFTSQNFLGHCFLDLVPEKIKHIPPEQRLSTLARLWNLGEGLLGEPAWVNRYIVSRSRELQDLSAVEDFLIHALGPVLTPPTPASWSGPFSVLRLNTRKQSSDFLPGSMYLASPLVVCIRDRNDPNQQLALFLAHGQKSWFLGATTTLDSWRREASLPAVTLEQDGRLAVGSQRTSLPFVRHLQDVLVVEGGFVVLSAVDSQCLWILESP